METYGLSLKELEAQNVELLPDRIEMKHRRRHRRQRVVCQSVAAIIAGDDVGSNANAAAINFCPGLQA